MIDTDWKEDRPRFFKFFLFFPARIFRKVVGGGGAQAGQYFISGKKIGEATTHVVAVEQQDTNEKISMRVFCVAAVVTCRQGSKVFDRYPPIDNPIYCEFFDPYPYNLYFFSNAEFVAFPVQSHFSGPCNHRISNFSLIFTTVYSETYHPNDTESKLDPLTTPEKAAFS